MLVEKVIINASPFIILCKSDLIGLLPKLFNEIYMPESVSIEIIEGKDIATKKIHDFRKTWLKVIPVEVSDDILVWNLGDGETGVLSFALKNSSEFTALLDDRAARRCAETFGIKTLGTVGILILAKRRNLLEDISVELEKLKNAGLWLSDEIFNKALKLSEE